MNLTDRARNILLTPLREWPVIAGESANLTTLLLTYVVPLSAISFGANLINSTISGSVISGVKLGLVSMISSIVSFVVTSHVVDLLAPTFKSEKDINKSAQLVAYSFTASAVAALGLLVPFLGWMVSLAGAAYSVYLMYLGIGQMKKTPDDQRVMYVVVVFVVLLISVTIVGSLLAGLLVASVS